MSYEYKSINFISNPVLSNSKFLSSNDVTATLSVYFDNKEYILTRSFGEPTIFKINETEYSNDSDYQKAIEMLFFNIKDSRPTLRQIMPKFIRKNSEGMSNSVKYLFSTTTDNDYELIYTYFFGVSEMEMTKERYKLKKEISKLNKKLTALKDGNTLPALRQFVKAIDRTIKEEEAKKKLYNIDKSYDEKILELQKIKKENSEISNKIAGLETEIQMNQLTVSELKANISNADPKVIYELYKEANHYIKDLNKDFEQLLYFHNHLIENKIEFVKKNLNSKIETRNQLESTLSINLKDEREILRMLSSKGVFDSLEILVDKINKLYQEKGKREQLIEAINETAGYRGELANKLLKLNELYQQTLKELDNNISNFNKFFQTYSKELYGEDFYLYPDDSKESLKFQIDNLAKNVGSGKKKATIAAFDFSFISYFSETDRSLPRFVLHDGIEDIADNQIKTLFNIAETIDGQYIVSLISDRLSSIGLPDEFIEKNTILLLNQEDRFFKVK